MRLVIVLILCSCCHQTNSQDVPLISHGPKSDINLIARKIDLHQLIENRSWRYEHETWPGYQLIDYVDSDFVQDQLRFTESQNKRFEKLRKEYQKAYAKTYSDTQEPRDRNTFGDSDPVTNKWVYLAQKKLREEFSEQIRQMLTPRQLAMVRTLIFYSSIRSNGLAQALSGAPFDNDLGITEPQKKELVRIRNEAQAAMNKKMEEMKANAKREMLKVLNVQQRNTLKEIEEGKELISR